jgi:uncharacterized repeat protein (TIGR01451 family)
MKKYVLFCIGLICNILFSQTSIKGIAYHDISSNCSFDLNDFSASNTLVKATNIGTSANYFTFTDANGYFRFINLPMGVYSVMLQSPFISDAFISSCSVSSVLPLATAADSIVVSLSIPPDFSSKKIDVSIIASELTHCSNSELKIRYKNTTSETQNFNIILDIPTDISYVASPLTSTVDNLGHIVFNKTIAPYQEGTFPITVFPSCNAAIGQYHCIKVSSEPTTIDTTEFPQLKVYGKYNNNNSIVKYKVYSNYQNQNQLSIRFYDIIEDDIVIKEGFVPAVGGGQLDSFTIEQNAIVGKVYTLRTNQDTNFASLFSGSALDINSNLVSYTVQAVDGNIFPSGDFIDMFNHYDITGNTVCLRTGESLQYCNLKSTPKGYGLDKVIKPRDEIEQTITFKNIGNNTVSNLLIVDSMSSKIDLGTFKIEGSTHDYSLRVMDNIIYFSFPNQIIQSNELVSLKVKFKLNANVVNFQNGYTIIFDNDTCYTQSNSYYVNDFVIPKVVSIKENFNTPIVKLYPNPTTDFITLTVAEAKPYLVKIINMSGEVVFTTTTSSEQTNIDASNLAEGLYIVQLHDGMQYFNAKITVINLK